MGLLVLPIAVCTGSLDLDSIVSFQTRSGWLVLPLFPIFVLFVITSLA
jgi:NADH:ubiquinone oxidoreductase subunit H